jgi:enoyl-CoA hydratase/carnithine racemase
MAIRSNHKKVFCAGADIKDFLVNYESNRYNAVRPLNLGKAFRQVRKVLVAVVEGAALGGGF